MKQETLGPHLVLQTFKIDINNQTTVMGQKVLWREHSLSWSVNTRIIGLPVLATLDPVA